MQEKHIVIDISVKSFVKKIKQIPKKSNIPIIVLIIIISLTTLYAQTAIDLLSEVKHKPKDGDAIYAAQINENFQTLYDKVNELLGDNPDVGIMGINTKALDLIKDVEDTRSEYYSKFTDISKVIPNPESGLDSGFIVAWYSTLDKMESYKDQWLVCDDIDVSTPDLRGKFVIGAGKDDPSDTTIVTPYQSDDLLASDPSLIITNGDSGSPTHQHTLDHKHLTNEVSYESTGYHNHIWLKLKRYTSIPLLNPWKWITFDGGLNEISTVFSEYDDQYGFTINDGSATSTVFGVNTAYLPAVATVEFRTDYNVSLHRHSIDSNIPVKNLANTGPAISEAKSALPPYYALYFVKKK